MLFLNISAFVCIAVLSLIWLVVYAYKLEAGIWMVPIIVPIVLLSIVVELTHGKLMKENQENPKD